MCAMSQPLVAGMMQKAVPGRVVSATNTTRDTLRCVVQVEGKTWQAVELAPGREWVRRTYSGDSQSAIQCEAPVRQAQFVLLPGKRYVFLRNGSVIELKEATIPARR